MSEPDYEELKQNWLQERAERQRLEQLLEAKTRELEQFAYIASHDLQEPLRKIRNFTEMLQEQLQGQLDGRAQKYMHYIVDGAGRMQSLLQNLLYYSRALRPAPRQSVSLNEVLHLTLSDLELAIQENEAEIISDDLPVITANPTQMQQLFLNLISNALKFSQTKPMITIKVSQDEQEWRLSFNDNGIGIPDDQRERIFQAFQRLHRQADYPGTGIGLAICQKVVEQHGGQIWVESELERGSTFFVTLPKQGEAE